MQSKNWMKPKSDGSISRPENSISISSVAFFPIPPCSCSHPRSLQPLLRTWSQFSLLISHFSFHFLSSFSFSLPSSSFHFAREITAPNPTTCSANHRKRRARPSIFCISGFTCLFATFIFPIAAVAWWTCILILIFFSRFEYFRFLLFFCCLIQCWNG